MKLWQGSYPGLTRSMSQSGLTYQGGNVMPRRPGFKFNEMTVPELLRLQEQIQAALAGKRQELQRQLDALSTLEPGTSSLGSGGRGRRPRADARSKRGNGRAHPLKGRTVAPKYR